MVQPDVIAHIVAEVRRQAGQTVNETELSSIIEAGFTKLKLESEQKYLEIIHELSAELEILAKEVGRVRNITTGNS